MTSCRAYILQLHTPIRKLPEYTALYMSADNLRIEEKMKPILNHATTQGK